MTMSISFRKSKQTVSFAHDQRTPETKLKGYETHIDKARTHLNDHIISCDSPEDFYNQIFGDALKKYNSKQKRKDRRIKNYYDHVKHDVKKKPFYEFVVQAGEKGNCLTDDQAKQFYRNYLKGFQKRNPNLVVASATTHLDETTPHLHLIVVPIVRGRKRGLEVQNSWTGAIGRGKESWQVFRDGETNALETQLNALGVTRKKVGTHTHLEPAQYRELMKKANDTLENAQKTSKAVLTVSKEKARETLKNAQTTSQELLEGAKAEKEAQDKRKAGIDKYRAEVAECDKRWKSRVRAKINELAKRENEILLSEASISKKQDELSQREDSVSQRERDITLRESRADDFFKELQRRTSEMMLKIAKKLDNLKHMSREELKKRAEEVDEIKQSKEFNRLVRGDDLNLEDGLKDLQTVSDELNLDGLDDSRQY